MWIKNIRTAKQWYVSEERGKILLKDDDYVSLEKQADSGFSLDELTVSALKKRAADKGIENYQSLDKEALIKALDK
ncbi:hypothetical protein NIE88_18850 [Sporolactobacillus shoreicorticis]|uniref:Rho termination factor N-terminal domain-containing protein n=1 Tax=Sporolactobacillus shoreicorticis TaxID=1923877 RepID=A0ABW5S5T1_9BACL|nr:hypothetical protein [Sporolactobacillus shoreicorticis]MCO7127809.1 hypothetical protein [Sporolactobacillus shoreicorticis]